MQLEPYTSSEWCGRGTSPVVCPRGEPVSRRNAANRITGAQSTPVDPNQHGQGRKSSQIDRKAFKAEREALWKNEAKEHPDNYSKKNLERMQQGKPPIGSDGHPMELHHADRTPDGRLEPMIRNDHRWNDHRLGENYKVDKAAQSLDPGAQTKLPDGEVFTLGEDRIWRNAVGDTLYHDDKTDTNKVHSQMA